MHLQNFKPIIDPPLKKI